MPPVVPGLPLSKYSNKELAVRVARQSRLPRQDPGIAWARLMHTANRPEKDVAREAVLRLLTVDQFPYLSILTFPASEWRFESALLAMREGEKIERAGPGVTTIEGIERDEAVYRAAVHNIPQGRVSKEAKARARRRARVRVYDVPAFATACVGTVLIGKFYRCTFEEYAKRGDLYSCRRVFDAAWLDFNGHLSRHRLDAIERFWNQQVRSLLVVTLLNARAKLDAGVAEALAVRLPGSRIESVMQYGDGAPMIQVVLRRDTGQPSLAAPAKNAVPETSTSAAS